MWAGWEAAQSGCGQPWAVTGGLWHEWGARKLWGAVGSTCRTGLACAALLAPQEHSKLFCLCQKPFDDATPMVSCANCKVRVVLGGAVWGFVQLAMC